MWDEIVSEAIAIYGDTPDAKGWAVREFEKQQRYQGLFHGNAIALACAERIASSQKQ